MIDAARRLKWALAGRVRHSTWLAVLWRRLMWRTTVIAVTGSVGKTTCRLLLYQILSEQANTYQTPNNQNDAHSVPGVLLGMRPWHRYAVIEVAANGTGTLGPLARMVRPDIAIVTAVKHTHMMHYQDIEAVAREKSELLRYLRPLGHAVLNGDDARVAAMALQPGQTRSEFGRSSDSDFFAKDVSACWPQRLELTVCSALSEQRVRTQLVGEHWTNSVLAAYSVAQHCDIAAADIVASMRKVVPFRGRMQPLTLPNGVTALHDQNASQDVFMAMLAVAQAAQAERKVLVLGNLNDSHLNTRAAQRRYVGTLVADVFDVVIFHGMSGSKAQKAAVAAGMELDNVHIAATLAEVDALLRQLLKPGDLLFVKGQNLQHLNRAIYMQAGVIGCQRDTCTIRSDCEVCSELRPDFDLANLAALPAE